ncbi:MAG: RNA 2',3'-cyclic phosphodiesterase [Candidatus Anoxychlamydiales bacterium]|nr:RNA 2',3'-cyclic phosphodiesterase [Candidatus Anoxychlamydiales bacterium]
MKKDTKRVFFGFEVFSNWLQTPDEKKVISENNRHITLLFLGENKILDIEFFLNNIPLLDLKTAPVGFFDEILFLPKNHPRLIAYKANFMDKEKRIQKFQKNIFDFFKNKNFEIKQNKDNFLPHITVCRNEFNIDEWKKSFEPFAFYVKSFNLFESLGNSEYKNLWKKEFIKPFEEIPHTADIAFEIKGETFLDLLHSAFIALSFKENKFLKYYKELKNVISIDDVIINLNELVTKAEIDGIHMPFKAISFHSDIKREDNILSWEMIVDV